MAFTNTPCSDSADLGHMSPRCSTLRGYGVAAILQSTAATTRPKYKSRHKGIAGAASHAHLHDVSTQVSLKLRLRPCGQTQDVVVPQKQTFKASVVCQEHDATNLPEVTLQRTDHSYWWPRGQRREC